MSITNCLLFTPGEVSNLDIPSSTGIFSGRGAGFGGVVVIEGETEPLLLTLSPRSYKEK